MCLISLKLCIMNVEINELNCDVYIYLSVLRYLGLIYYVIIIERLNHYLGHIFILMNSILIRTSKY